MANQSTTGTMGTTGGDYGWQPGADEADGSDGDAGRVTGGGKPLSGTDTDSTAGEANQTSTQGKPPATGTPGSIGTMGGTDRSETPGISRGSPSRR